MNRIQTIVGATVMAVSTSLIGAPTLAEALVVVAGDDDESLRESIDDALRSVADLDEPLARELSQRVLTEWNRGPDPRSRFAALQRALDSACMLEVHINPESRVKVASGPAAMWLKTGAWRTCLVKVHNMAGVTAPLRLSSPQAVHASQPDSREAWLEISMHSADGVAPELTGELIEYRVVKLRTDELGDRSAIIAMDVGQGTADIGFRNDVLLTFRCEASTPPPSR